MQLLDRGGQLATRPAPNPTVSPGWANNDPTKSTPPTISDPDMLNAIMAEFKTILDAAGITMNKGNVGQLLAALRVVFPVGGYYAVDSGTANTVAVTLSPAPGALTSGMLIYIKIAATNSGASTLNTNGLGPVAIHNPDSSALTSGQLTVGDIVEVIYTGSVWTLLSVNTAFAALNGSSSQVFNVANATTATEAVALGQFGSLLSANGYQRLPSGLIVQWGSGVCSVLQTAQSFSFPITFPNALLLPVAGSLSLNSYGGCVVSFSTTSSISLFSSNSGGAVSYVAFGW